MEKREGFVFYESWFQAIQSLNDNDKLCMYQKICCYGLGLEHELPEHLKPYWILIKPQIDSNNKRYQSGKKGGRPTKEKSEGLTNEKPMVIENKNQRLLKNKAKEKVKDKVKDKEERIDFGALLLFVNNAFQRKFKVISNKAKKQYNLRLEEGYSKADITTAINNCVKNKYHIESNYQYCTPEFFSRAETLEKYSDTTKQQKVVHAFHPIIFD